MDLLKKILDFLADLPKLTSQALVVYQILNSVISVLEKIVEVFDVPEIENVLDPLRKVLDFISKFFNVAGIDPNDENVEGAQFSAQSLDVQLKSLAARYDELELEE